MKKESPAGAGLDDSGYISEWLNPVIGATAFENIFEKIFKNAA